MLILNFELVADLSYFRPQNCRYHANSVAGFTIWQQLRRSAGLNTLPAVASRRRCSTAKVSRFPSVKLLMSALKALTSCWE